MKVAAIDFDGTLAENAFPEIGKPIMPMVNFVKDMQKRGWKLILWTCRNGEALENAIEFCKMVGLSFDAINKNLPEIIELMKEIQERFMQLSILMTRQ